MRYQIDSRRLQRPVIFSRPGREYLYIDLNGQSGTLGQQICEGGQLRGSTITYRGEDRTQFERICKRWWRAYLRHSD